MSALADFIARHAVAVLLLVTCAGWVLTAAFWHVVHTHGDRAWSVAVRVWNALRSNRWARELRGVPIVGSFCAHTLTVVRYLGLYAIAAFAIAVVALVTFLELVDKIGLDEDLARFDVALADALNRHLSDEVLHAFSLITHLGDRAVLAVLTSLVLVALLIAKRWVLAGAWVAAMAGGGLINGVLKTIYERSRPIHDHGFAHETSWSFPSGHASASMLFYSLLGYLFVRHLPRAWHIPISVTTLAMVVFVGSSRVLLQVHYFSDVLAGYASATTWSALCIGGLETARWRKERGAQPGLLSPD